MDDFEEAYLQKTRYSSEAPDAVLFYTPFCGTCRVAEKMLDVVMEMRPDLKIGKCNVNFAQNIVQDWQITSVPCLTVLQHGIPMRKEYAMRDVRHLLEVLRPIDS